MDTKKLLESLDFSKENINRQALVYSFSNIFTLSMLSGFGVKHKIPTRTTDGFLKKLNKEFGLTSKSKKNDELETLLVSDELDLPAKKDKPFTIDKNFQFIKDLSPIKAVYSRTSLSQCTEDDCEKNKVFKLDLDDKVLEKNINPKNQGLLILNEINLSKLLHDKSVIKRNKKSSSQEKFIGLIMLDLAMNQAIFSQSNLRNSSGLFVEMEDHSSSLNELNLTEKNSAINWENQAYMLYAYSLLYHSLNDPKYKRYFNSGKANLFKGYALDLLGIIKEHEYDVIDLDTASLSSFLSSLIESLNILDIERKYLDFVLSLCDELYAREKQSGFMQYDKYAKEAASLATHFKSMEALSSGFQYTNYNLFLNASEEIYDNLNSIWDKNLGLFKLEDKERIKYSSKSISYVLKSLNKLSKTTSSTTLKDSIKSQLTDFFDSSINGAGLQSPPPGLRMDINMFRSSDTTSAVIEDIVEDKNAYVIEKGFEINKSNSQISKYSNEFSSEHVLFASDAMLSLAMEEEEKVQSSKSKL